MRMKFMAVTVVVLLALAGCTHDGGIGLWGGTWHLEQMIADGTADACYGGNVFWKFQNDVVNMVETDDEMHERKDHYGTWSVSDDGTVLILDFSHSSDRFPAGSEDYVPPKVTGLTGGVTRLEVERLTGKEMIVRTDETVSGKMTKYVLKKQ